MKSRLSTLVLLLTFFVGLAVLLYPVVSDYWNSKVQSKAIVHYEEALSALTQKDYSAYFTQADAYNAAIPTLSFPLMTFPTLAQREDLLPYDDLLNVDGNGIFGYINIPTIGVELPIYHGTSVAVLNVAVGHLEGTSLPVGGDTTHCVLSAHRGLPSAKLFSDLDKLREGDTFTITVLNRLLTYEVESIAIVEPNDVDSLYTVSGRDLCTLVTCTPYGINTHRLLVTAHRVENASEKPLIYVPADGFLIDSLITAPIIAALILFVLLIILLIRTRKGAKPNEHSA